MPKLIVKCKECGFDFRENEFIDAYKFQGDIYCEEWVYLNHGYMEE